MKQKNPCIKHALVVTQTLGTPRPLPPSPGVQTPPSCPFSQVSLGQGPEYPVWEWDTQCHIKWYLLSCFSLSLSLSPVGRHENLDVATGIKSIQLVDQLQHGTLDFIRTTVTITEPGT